MSTKTLSSISKDEPVYKEGRFSSLVKPVIYFIDSSILIASSYLVFDQGLSRTVFLIFVMLCWFIGSIQLNFYSVRRDTKLGELILILLKQFLLISFTCFAIIGFYYFGSINTIQAFTYILVTWSLIAFFKATLYFFFKYYRAHLGGNFRNVVIIGDDENSQKLNSYFTRNKHLGYRVGNVFSYNSSMDSQSIKDFVIDNDINEIYLNTALMSNKQIIDFINFADHHMRITKFIPSGERFSHLNLNYEIYGGIPVQVMRYMPLDDPLNALTKRVFDIVFSLLVILFIMSWLVPLLAIIIKLESKGPVFFSQPRNGLDFKEFTCYKFRSMVVNENFMSQVAKNDVRITKIGKFIRKTSLDEMPQFFNVLIGDMSVVGPRPQMPDLNEGYQKTVDRFMVRHLIKPGITGLAQVTGLRGMTENDQAMENRVRSDVYYLENWSLALDLNIIIQTVINIIVGEEQAI